MLNVFVVGRDSIPPSLSAILIALQQARYTVAYASLDGERLEHALLEAFAGRPPDVLIPDLSTAPDCLPLRHLRCTVRTLWGEEAPFPLVLALCLAEHLSQPEFPALVDDLLLPPYTETEALGRLRLLLFRRRQVHHSATLSLPGLTLVLASRQAQTTDGRILPLRPREYDLLYFLATHHGKLFSRERLVDLVWGLDFEGGARTVDIHIQRLRTKLPPATSSLLETQRGGGYRLNRKHNEE